MGRKWNNIKEKKAAKDKDTSRINAKFGREIYVAAKSGEPDPVSNGALKIVLERAKTYSVPKHIIDRAIDKAKGNVDEVYDELRYEGFGPNGSMVIVDALTNNVNRTASDVRAAFGKNGGNMGVKGSVDYMFNKTAVFGVEGKTADELLEVFIMADIDVRDVFEEGDVTIVYAEPTDFARVDLGGRRIIKKKITVAEISMLPQTEVQLDEASMAQFEKMIDALEELEDVQQVYHNVEQA